MRLVCCRLFPTKLNKLVTVLFITEDVEDVASPMAVNQLMIMASLTLVKIQVGFEKVSLGRSVKNMRKRY